VVIKLNTWKTVKVGELGKIVTGKTPKTAISENYGGSIPFLTPSDNMSVKYIEKTAKTLTERGLSEVKNMLLPSNAVCVSCIGSDLGKVVITTQNTVTNQQINSIIVDTMKFDVSFVYYAMLVLGKELNFISKTSTAVPIINKSSFSSYEIKCPSLEQQKKISSVLSALDSKIECNQKINSTLEVQAATIFTEWLSSCTDSATIGDLSKNILDYSPITNDMIRLLNSSDVTEGVFSNAPLVSNKDLKGHFKKRFQYGDILYSEIRPRNHHYGLVLFETSEYIASTRLMVIRAIVNKVSPAILYQYLLLPEVEAEFTLKTESRSGTFPQGNYADMASIVVPYSSIESQIEVSAILSEIRNIIVLNQVENQRLVELRDTLLPKLMSGEIDVSNIQI
jgi:type I restriction enzyme S subunit